MSAMNETESPLERLKYINGQRLDASDFRLEQDYHMRVRRKLNRSLYSSGIADGLEVIPKSGDAHKLLVSPGLALDHEGREVILVEEQEVQAMGSPSDEDGHIPGNYLVIQYSESDVAPMESGCHVSAGDESATARNLSWVGQTRIRSSVQLKWRDTLPEENSGQILLAQVALNADCSVQYVDTALRQYIGVARATRISSYALEGEKDIDRFNAKRIYFHVAGRRPDSVTLYLRAARFSTFFYTEMARHNHPISVSEQEAGGFPAHSHTLGSFRTAEAYPEHSHTMHAWTDDLNDRDFGKIELDPGRDSNAVYLNLHEDRGSIGASISSEVTVHDHVVPAGIETSVAPGQPHHRHNVSASSANTGTPDNQNLGINTAAQLTFVNNLKVLINGADMTEKILAYLNSQSRGEIWTRLGDGTDGHPLAIGGTGPIQLDFIPGINLKQDENLIELRMDGNGGGRILYNLYVE